jgi:hypothetical protein
MEPAKNAHNVAFTARFLLENQYVDRERRLIWLCKRDAAELGVGADKLARLAGDAPEEDGRKGLTANRFADLVGLQLRELGAELPLDWRFMGRKTDTPRAFMEFVEALKRALQAVIEEYAMAKDKPPDKAAALDVRRQLQGAETAHVEPAAVVEAAGKRVRAIRFLGGSWEIEFDGNRKGYANNVGFQYLAMLLKTPGEDWPAWKLQASIVNPNPATGTVKNARRNKPDKNAPGDIGSQYPIMDRAYQDNVKQQLQKLSNDRAELDPEDPADKVQIAEIDKESREIAEQLRGAKNIHGRDRMMSANAERARKAVKEALDRVLNRIKERQPEAHQILQTGLHTGNSLRYTGPSWEVQT